MQEKILIIDDEPDILKLLATILEEEGYAVLTAADGQEGLARFRTDRPDLVITDMKMPRKNGLDVLKEIKAAGTEVEIIILTGHSDETTAIDCLRAGAYDYILKPLEELDVILVSIERALYKRSLEINNKQLVQQIEEMAVKDPLTGLLNFRQLHLALDEEITRSKRYSHVFCGFMLEIDGFQTLTATYGHLFGDYVLQRLAEIMRQALRTVDRLFRYGNASFFIILPETNHVQAVVAVDRLMTMIRTYPFRCDELQMHITLSIGGAQFPDHGDAPATLLRYAEKALFHAQKIGGDQAILNG